MNLQMKAGTIERAAGGTALDAVVCGRWPVGALGSSGFAVWAGAPRGVITPSEVEQSWPPKEVQ